MLRALARDLADVPDVRVVTTRDARLPALDLPLEVVAVGDVALARQQWVELLDRVDAVWPIAPESGGLLARISDTVVESGRVLLGSTPDAIRVGASKRATAWCLERAGVPIVPTWLLDDDAREIRGAWIVKPDDGVACAGCRLGEGELALEALRTSLDERQVWIVQPWLEGEVRSLSLLCRDGLARVLACNRQCVARVGEGLLLQGCVVNAYSGARLGYHWLAQKIAGALPGLWGYVGVDFIHTVGGPRVLEVNPRLSTSYVGLRQSLGVNPAALVLDLLRAASELPDVAEPCSAVAVGV